MAAIGLIAAGCFHDKPQAQSGPPGPPKVTVARPVVKKIIEWDDFTGRFAATDSVDVRARVSGYLQEVHFEEGALVKDGDLLITIDQRPYQAALDEAKAALIVARTEFDFASKELERAEALVERGNISRSALDERRQRYSAGQAEIEGAKAAVRRAELDMEFTEIRAPIAGRISNKRVSVGNLINANDTVLTNIASLDPIHFYFDVDERSYLAYARMAREGTRPSGRITPYEVRVSVADDAVGEQVGFLDFVDNRIDESTGTMRGRALFPNESLILQPGLFGRISIPGSPLYDAVLIPDEAIGNDQDRRIVYVVDDNNTVSAKVIRPGPRIDGYRVVRKGLDGTETIVVKGLIRVRPGIEIDPEVIDLPPNRS